MARLKAVSLFCGCGGMDLGMVGGFEYLGKKYLRHQVEIVYAIDNDAYACETFNNNFDIKSVCEDIRDVNNIHFPPHHLLIGGFPCESFSIVAQNPPRLGCKGEKGMLFFEMCRVLKERKPICFIAENVKGILSANEKRAFPLIMDNFKNASYHVTHFILDASDFGVPQKRQRVFIVGFRDKKILANFAPPKPISGDKVALKKVMLPEEQVDSKYYFSKKAIEGMERVKEKMNKGRIQNLDGPCNTINAHLAKVSLNSTDPVLLINGKYRRFTPKEAARIQSFPDKFNFNGPDTRQYRAIGNAVPPVLMWHVTKSVLDAIRRTNKKYFEMPPFRTAEEIRSYNMSQIKSRDTSLELTLRKALWKRGYRYRLYSKKVTGKPDIIFGSHRVAIFCDSSFWHGREYKEDTDRIKTRKKYWQQKIKRNIQRDDEVNKRLKDAGWTVLRFWDVDIKNNLEHVISSIEKHINGGV